MISRCFFPAADRKHPRTPRTARLWSAVLLAHHHDQRMKFIRVPHPRLATLAGKSVPRQPLDHFIARSLRLQSMPDRYPSQIFVHHHRLVAHAYSRIASAVSGPRRGCHCSAAAPRFASSPAARTTRPPPQTESPESAYRRRLAHHISRRPKQRAQLLFPGRRQPCRISTGRGRLDSPGGRSTARHEVFCVR